MRSLDRLHLVLALLALVVLGGPFARPAAAQVPSASHCKVPSKLLSTSSGSAGSPRDTIIVRDASNTPISSALVTIDFRNSGMTPYANQPSGITPVDGFCQMLTMVTDATGRVIFSPRMSGYENDTRIVIYARTALCDSAICLAHIRGTSTDFITSVPAANRWNTPESVGLPEFAAFSSAYTSHSADPRYDFDGNGSIGLGDLALFTAEYGYYSALLCLP